MLFIKERTKISERLSKNDHGFHFLTRIVFIYMNFFVTLENNIYIFEIKSYDELTFMFELLPLL